MVVIVVNISRTVYHVKAISTHFLFFIAVQGSAGRGLGGKTKNKHELFFFKL